MNLGYLLIVEVAKPNPPSTRITNFVTASIQALKGECPKVGLSEYR